MASSAKERATLIAAVIAALASIVAALLSAYSSRSVAAFEAAQAEKLASETSAALANHERLSFRRDQLDRLSTYALHAAVELQTQIDASALVSWIAATTEAEIAEREFRSIEQIRHALTQLEAMGVIQEAQLSLAQDLISSLVLDWRQFSSTRSAYRKALHAGEIESSGHATESAEGLQNRYIEKSSQMNQSLKKLREILSNVQSAIAGGTT